MIATVERLPVRAADPELLVSMFILSPARLIIIKVTGALPPLNSEIGPVLELRQVLQNVTGGVALPRVVVRGKGGLGATLTDVYSLSQIGGCRVSAEVLFALGYLLSALIALSASKLAANPGGLSAAPFWWRIALVCGLFAILRLISAQTAVSTAISNFSRSEGLQHWERPGPYLMLIALGALGMALIGLLVLRRRDIHPSINIAAAAMVGLVVLALSHSLSLYLPIAILQAPVGAFTVSRIIEASLLVLLGVSALWFVAGERRGAAGRAR